MKFFNVIAWIVLAYSSLMFLGRTWGYFQFQSKVEEARKINPRFKCAEIDFKIRFYVATIVISICWLLFGIF